MRRFDDNPNETYMKDFVESAMKYKDDDILIIDLRGNYGDTSFWNELWLSEYMNGTVKDGVVTIDFLNSINR